MKFDIIIDHKEPEKETTAKNKTQAENAVEIKALYNDTISRMTADKAEHYLSGNGTVTETGDCYEQCNKRPYAERLENRP